MLEEEAGRQIPDFEIGRPGIADESDDPGDTVKLSRETVDRALGGGDGPDATDEDSWEPEVELEPQIARFNAMQRLLYRTIRAEVGAGAANFVRSCGADLDATLAEMFTGLELQADGAWHPGDLKRGLVERRISEPWNGFQRLIDQEVRQLEVHIGETRIDAIRQRLAELADGSEAEGY